MHELKQIYEEIVHWRPNFFLLSKNKSGYQFVETLNTILSHLAQPSPKSEFSMIAGRHEQLGPYEVQDQELAFVQYSAEATRIAVDLV